MPEVLRTSTAPTQVFELPAPGAEHPTVARLRAELVEAAEAHAVELAAAVAAARAEGFADGHAAGFAEGDLVGYARGRDEIEVAAAAFSDAVAATFARMVDAVAAAKVEVSTHALELASTIVTATHRHPGAAAEGLVARVAEALAAVDDPSPVLSVHPDDLRAVSTFLADVDGIDVTVDPALQRGECTLAGRWASADLTWPVLRHAADVALEQAIAEGVLAASLPAPADTAEVDTAEVDEDAIAVDVEGEEAGL